MDESSRKAEIQKEHSISIHLSVEHPQANALQDANGLWADELPQVIWAYRTTLHSTTGELPFRLAYEIEVMIPVEVEEGSPRVILCIEDTNFQNQREELDLLPEVGERARIIEEALKRGMTLRYNGKVVQGSFTTNDLILIQNDIRAGQSGEGKLAANWKGPYRVTDVLGKGNYKVAVHTLGRDVQPGMFYRQNDRPLQVRTNRPFLKELGQVTGKPNKGPK